ncbi:MAG: thiamine pyrophosphate-binding protein, partial [Dehalococcoidia bacterium]|nr:thiamine pyrophosphate-binding protein [Dehalococcoidia bacterium]
MSRMTAEEIVIGCLKNEGVQYIFGSPGDDQLSLIDRIYRDGGIKLFDTRHENTGPLAAMGYAQATGRLAVCTATVGPGVANFFNGMMCAWRSRAPVVAIVFKHAPGLYERDIMKSFDQSAVFQHITKWVIDVDRIEHIADALWRAFRAASCSPTGPVMVCINEQLFQHHKGPLLETELPPREQLHPASRITYTDPAIAEQAARMLLESNLPLLVADDRCYWNGSEEEIAELANLLAIPVVQVWSNFRPIMPESSPLVWGSLAGYATAPTLQLMKESDLLLAVDCTFDTYLSTDSGYHEIGFVPGRFHQRIVQIDSDPHFIAKIYPVELGILGHSKGVLKQIIQAVKKLGVNENARAERLDKLRRMRDEWMGIVDKELEKVHDQVPIAPIRLVQAMNNVLGKDDMIVTGGAIIKGAFQAMGNFIACEPRTVFSMGYEGSLGQSLGRAMGVKIACPNKRVTALCGDGEFWYCNASELETLRRHHLPISIVISNNGV